MVDAKLQAPCLLGSWNRSLMNFFVAAMSLSVLFGGILIRCSSKRCLVLFDSDAEFSGEDAGKVL